MQGGTDTIENSAADVTATADSPQKIAVDSIDDNSKNRRQRRKYSEAFSNPTEDDFELEEHIVPEPTVTNTKNTSGELQSVEVINPGPQKAPTASFICQHESCLKEFSSMKLYKTHYYSSHMYSCSICKKQIISSHLLDLHVLEVHDSFFALQAKKQAMYQCFLESCREKFMTPEIRTEHCVVVHKLPENFKYWNFLPTKANIRKAQNSQKNATSNAKNKNKSAEVKMDVSTDNENPSANLPTKETGVALLPANKQKQSEIQEYKGKRTVQISFGRSAHRAFKNSFAVKKESGVVQHPPSENCLEMNEVQDAINSMT